MTREFLTVAELADLLRIKERKVYDMAASGTVPCTRATGKLLFPEDEVRAWISRNQTGHRPQRPRVFLGSHDPLLEWALRQSQCGLATYLDGSADGLRRFEKGEGLATGLHIRNREDDDWNTEVVQSNFSSDNVVLISFAKRRRGLVCKPESVDAISQISDLEGRKIATRHPHSGTYDLFANLSSEAGLGDYSSIGPFHSEEDAVLAVVSDEADVAFGLETIAVRFNLGFVPVLTERFDLLVSRTAYFDQPFQKFLRFCRSASFSEHIQNMPGYVADDIGSVIWNA